jgi:hypothetical protein
MGSEKQLNFQTLPNGFDNRPAISTMTNGAQTMP